MESTNPPNPTAVVTTAPPPPWFVVTRQRALLGYFFLIGLSTGLFPPAMMGYSIYPHPSFLWAGYTAVAATAVWGLVIASTEGGLANLTKRLQEMRPTRDRT